MSSEHLTPEELAALADGSLERHDARRVVAHVEHCARCAEVYHGGVCVLGSLGDELPAHALPDAVVERTRGEGRRGRAGKRGRAYRRLIPLVAAGGLALLLWPRGGERPAALGLDLFPVIESAAGAASSYSMLIIPGTENRIVSPGTTYRSGAPKAPARLQDALDALLEMRDDDTFNAAAVYALIAGEIAAGNYRMANDLAGDAMRLFGERAEFSAARGIALFHLEHLASARAALEAAAGLAPDQPVYRYNLAVVLHETGESDACRALAAGVALEAAGTPLAERAQALLSNHR